MLLKSPPMKQLTFKVALAKLGNKAQPRIMIDLTMSMSTQESELSKLPT